MTMPFTVDLSAKADAVTMDCLEAFPEARLKVTGRCMVPALADGETVRLEATARRPPRLGDIVLARLPEGIRLHRVVWGPPFPGRLRTQADSGWRWDPPISLEAVLGTVVGVADEPGRVVRDVGRALRSLSRALRTRLLPEKA
jgi:hypothetical protein